VTGAALALAAAAAAAVPAAVPPAAAREEFAKREDRQCIFCHLAEKGGGPRNENGKLFEANGFTFARDTWSGEPAKAAYRRAVAAYRATHYAEVARILLDLRRSEKTPGGAALLADLEEKLRPFAPAWLRASKRNLAGTAAQRAVGLEYLLRLLRECPGTPEAKEGEGILAGLRKDARNAEAIAAAEKAEEGRLRYLAARLLEETGDREGAKKGYRAVVDGWPATSAAREAKERLDATEAPPAKKG